jgi:hypothetical protein
MDCGTWSAVKDCDCTPSPIETQGRLINEDDESITLAQSQACDDGEVRGTVTIPKGTIDDRLWGERLIEKIREEMAKESSSRG